MLDLSATLPDHVTSLTTLDVSYNALTGAVPMQGQFLVFNESSFVGNPGLCGGPLAAADDALACGDLGSGAGAGLMSLRRWDSKKMLVCLAAVLAALVAAMIVSAAIALLLERFAYRPLIKKGAPKLIALISAIGASFALAEAMGLRVAAANRTDRPGACFTVHFSENHLKRSGEIG
jgi:hypothetical protein